MKPLDIAHYVAIAMFVAFFSVIMNRDFFSEPSSYVFEELGHKCIVVEDGRKIVMWCMSLEETPKLPAVHRTIAEKHLHSQQ